MADHLIRRLGGGRSPREPRVVVFPTVDEMARSVADRFQETSTQAVRTRGRFSVALSGGRTPIGPYRLVAREAARRPDGIDWERVHVFLVDERFVPYDDEQSNYGMIRRNLLDAVPIPPVNVHPIITEGDPVASAERYESEIRGFFADTDVPEFDLILLGMGEDGHTASLFPESPGATDDGRLVRAIGPGRERTARITLTLRAINHGRSVVFLVAGANKAGMTRRVIDEEDPGLPASLVRPAQGELLFLLDEQAASMLTFRPV